MSTKQPPIQRYWDFIRYSVKMNLRNRYNNMYLGIFWIVLDPILYMAVLTLVYTMIFDRNVNNFPVYVLIGLIFWKFFSSSITRSTNSINSKMGIIEQITVPKQIFILIDILVETTLFLISTVLIFIMMLIYNISFSFHMIEFLFVLLSSFVFIYGIGLVLAHIGAFVADFRIIVSYVLWMVFFLTAIFYYIDTIPSDLLVILKVNPAFTYVQSLRSVFMFGESPDYLLNLLWLIVGIMLIFIGTQLMNKFDKKYVLLK